jgi:methylated-DNA-[protein]-cysteine S-methyltransferase
MAFRHRIIQTRAGYVGLVASERGLRRLFLPEPRVAAAQENIRSEFEHAEADPVLLPDLAAQLERYFAGQPVEFEAVLDFGPASEFHAAVWQACRQIGYGQTSSYQQLAERAGRPRAARAVGGAMSRNPCPIVVPCHRVLRSDGNLGGYSGACGVAFKRELLDMERAAAGAPVA